MFSLSSPPLGFYFQMLCAMLRRGLHVVCHAYLAANINIGLRMATWERAVCVFVFEMVYTVRYSSCHLVDVTHLRMAADVPVLGATARRPSV